MPKRFAPNGPYSPPRPDEADQKGAEPMAVARDKTTPHDAFMPTTQSRDQLARDVAHKWRDPNLGPVVDGPNPGLGPESKAESRHPTGHKDSDQPGYKELDEDA